MFELQANQFHKVKPLIKDQWSNIEIRSVIAGYSPGWIFVDDDLQPTMAIVWSKGIEGMYFLGRPARPEEFDTINHFFDYQLIPRMKRQGLTDFEGSVLGQEWPDRLRQVFSHRNMVESIQLVYTKTFDHEQTQIDLEKTNEALEATGNGDISNVLAAAIQASAALVLPTGYHLEKVSGQLLDREGNHDFLLNNIITWWDSVDDFLVNGTGYAVYYDNEAVCSCITSFMEAGEMESHIETHKDHRNRGLASAAVRAFVADCRQNSRDLYWDCMETNAGSRALANKFGYSLDKSYTLFEFTL